MRRGSREGVARVAGDMRSFDASLDLLDASVAAAFGVSRSDLRAMEVVSRRGRLTCGELATELRLTTGSVTTLVDRMERAEYFRRGNHPADRRKVVVELTAKGKARERRAFGPLARESMKMLSRYDARELAVIRDFLQKASALADTARARITNRGRSE